MPSADIVDLRVEQDTYQGQPQHDTQPGVDPQEWNEVMGSWTLEAAAHAGRIVLTHWQTPEAGDVVPNQRELSRHQKNILRIWFSNFANPVRTRWEE